MPKWCSGSYMWLWVQIALLTTHLGCTGCDASKAPALEVSLMGLKRVLPQKMTLM